MPYQCTEKVFVVFIGYTISLIFYCIGQYKVQYIVMVFLYGILSFNFVISQLMWEMMKIALIICNANAPWHCLKLKSDPLDNLDFELALRYDGYIWVSDMLSWFPSTITSSKLNFGLTICLKQLGQFITLSKQ